MKHKFNDIEDAFLFSSGAFDGNTVYLCKETGRLYYVSDFGDSDEDLPEDLDDNEQYLVLPNKRDLDLGSHLARRFIEEHAAEFTNTVRDIFSRKGAYRRFKNFLIDKDMLDQWHAYENEQTAHALKTWCRDHEIELDE